MKHRMLCLLFTGCLLCGCKDPDQKTATPALPHKTSPVTVYTVHPDTFIWYGEYTGSFYPKQEARLVCYGGGRVDAIRVGDGSYVKAGTSLAAIDSTKAKNVLRSAHLQDKIAFKTLEQTKKHFTGGNASQLAVDQAELAYYTAKSAFIDAKKLYTGALAITPLYGTVISRSIALYQEVPPGAPTFTVAQTSVMRIPVAIPETEAALLQTGDSTEITSPLVPGRTWHGTIHSIAREAYPETRTFTTELFVDNADGVLKPGATAHVRIRLQQFTDALSVPATAVLSKDSLHSVMIVTSENRAHSIPIIRGAVSDSMVVIKKGLSAGDRIIVSLQNVHEGSPVIIE